MATSDPRWESALDEVGAMRGDRHRVFADLVERHRSGTRHYHVFSHASDVVDAVLGLRREGDAWGPAVLAAWFHDAVYAPGAADGANEGASAVFAQRSLRSMGAPLTVTAEVTRLICLTADHSPGDGDRLGALLCDADLSTLAADGDRYDAYTRAVRAEYAHVDEDAWREGRRRLLRGFLDRQWIYHSVSGRSQFEARARINISNELASL